MSTLSYAVSDSATMLRRYFKHQLRYPSVGLLVIGVPVIILLLFVYVLGGTLGAGLGGGGGDRADYANYLVPGIILLGLASAAQGTAISVSMDLAEGIIDRFRTMAIFRPSVLIGHVAGSVIQSMVGISVVVGVALLTGFRPTANPVEWLAAAGVVAMTSLAFTWLSVALGVVAKTVEAASNLPMPLILLPFLGSGFVPTDSMSAGVRWFAEYQPFTPIMETLRGLLLGTGIGSSGVVAVGWCAGITIVGYVWAKSRFNRDRETRPQLLSRASAAS
jgi:ABC-2 type transport system permease protein